ncbi:MAG TPA: glycosyltransferase [Bacteroidales bacterium]|nr:glycosyltransferase [Bacteroidales bacterium]
MIFTGLVSLFLLSAYIFTFFHFYLIWVKHKAYEAAFDSKDYPVLSVVVALRDVEDHVEALINSLKNQDYPAGKLEFIFVDDHSSDRTCQRLVAKTADMVNGRIIQLSEGNPGKKQALFAGVSNARGDLIVTTDADCTHPPGWLRIMADFYTTGHYRLISGPVRIFPATTFLERFQALEFASLTGTGGASFLAGSPLMCNGANLAFEKALFLEAYKHIHPGIPTGDDIFLMLYTKRHFPGRSGFVKHPQAIVNTRPVNNWLIFLQQRIRWASKSSYYRDKALVFMSVLILTTGVWTVFLLVSGLYDARMLVAFTVFIVLKSIPDIFFLERIIHFNGQRNLLRIFIPSQLLYPFYILIAAVGGLIKSGVYKRIG